MRYRITVEHAATVREQIDVDADSIETAKAIALTRDGDCEVVSLQPTGTMTVLGHDVLPEDPYALRVEDVFNSLYDQALDLQTDWEMYAGVFGTSEELIKKLNRRTGSVFRQYQVSSVSYTHLTLPTILRV